MTLHVVSPSAAPSPLWTLSTYDSGCASVAAPPGRGKGFTDVLTALLFQSGRIQPAPKTVWRAVTRTDAGRIQVGLHTRRFDVIVHNADQLAPTDAELVALITHRAGVDCWLVNNKIPDLRTEQLLERFQPRSWSAADAVDVWSTRPTAGGRTERWPCHHATGVDAGLIEAVGCTTHVDAFGCFLAWAPHAVATAAVDPAALRIRAFQLTQVDDPRRWAILSSGRDLHDFAWKAAIASGAGPDVRRRLKGRHVNTDASFLNLDQGYPVPEHLRPVIATHHAIRRADGFQDGWPVLHPSAPSVSQFCRTRVGDP